MNWLQAQSPHLTLGLEELTGLSESAFALDLPTRVDVSTPHTVFPLLVVRRDSPRLTVLHNGAVDLERSEGRAIFQRSSWWQEIATHQIFVCDPGTVGPQATSLNWMQAEPPMWPAHLTTKIVLMISRALGITAPEQRRYFGSSAGGFGALACLAYDPRASAVVNNAQFDWTRWYPEPVREVLHRRFAGRTAAEVRKRWPYRTNVLRHLGRGTLPLRVDYWANLASRYDREIQLPVWTDFLRRSPAVAGNSTLHGYFDEESGHNPLSRETTLALLND